MIFRQLIFVVFATLIPAMALSADSTQTYPNRPIRMVVPFPPGAATDNMARIVASRLQAALGQTFVVENRVGANGMIGALSVAKAPGDGYTLLYTASGPVATGLKLYDKVPYDASTEFVPVSLVIANTTILLANPKTGFRDFGQFVAYTKANPGKLTLGFGPAGGMGHLVMALFKQQTGDDINFVAYKGEAPVMVDMLGGTLDTMTGNLSSNREYIRGGKVTALAVASPKRSPLLPDTPTFSELGYPAMVAEAWSAVLAPAGTPTSIIMRLNSIHCLLGSFRDRIPAYASSAVLASAQAYAEQALDFQSRNWAAYKIHPPQVWDEDIELCDTVRKAVGDRYKLMLDSTWGYDYPQALRVGLAIQEMD